MSVPDYIMKRIRQTHKMPSIVDKSTPVLGFGDFLSATVATIGLNPSKREFLDKNGKLLSEDQRRLETLESLQLRSCRGAKEPHCRRIVESCCSYFSKNPYHWFRKFRPILAKLGVCYECGTACHLDLVQTSTCRVWRELSGEVKAYYLWTEGGFLRRQLTEHAIRRVLLNGKSVIEETERLFGVALARECCSFGGRRFEFVRGQICLEQRSVEVRGWSFNLQAERPPVGAALIGRLAELCADSPRGH